MAKKIMLRVTQPIHGADGHSVEYNPGDLLEPSTELPQGLEHYVTEVVADVPDEPKPKAKPEPETRPAPRPSGKA